MPGRYTHRVMTNNVVIDEIHWLAWLRECADDPRSPTGLTRDQLAMLTGQDKKALAAIAACWQLFFGADAEGESAAAYAITVLLQGLQPKCHFFAKELIAFAGDWSDRDRAWRLIERMQERRSAAVGEHIARKLFPF